MQFVSLQKLENIHYLFYITCLKIQNKKKIKHKSIEKLFQLKQNIILAMRPSLLGKYYADVCVTLNIHTAPAAFSPHNVNAEFLPTQTECNGMFSHLMADAMNS